MATKATKKAPAKRTDTGDDDKVQPHELMMSASVNGAVGMEAWSKFIGEVNIAELVDTMRGAVKRITDQGDQKPIEAMLIAQAHMLQTVATALIRKASFQDKLLQFQVHMNLGLKAQAQCRATLQALAEIRNPRPVAFVKQQNIAHGHQQVNNGNAQGDPHAHAGNSRVTQNELLGADDATLLRMVTGAPSAASGADPHLETVGA